MEFTGIIISAVFAYMTRNIKLNKALKLLFLYFILSEIFKQLMLFKINGYYDFWYFPFQLCSLPLYLIPLYLITGKRYFLSFLSDFCLLGGIFAFLDTSGMYYDFAALTLNSYLWHYMMIYLGIFLKFNIEADDLKEEIIIYLCCLIIAEIINFSFKAANMFYISPFHKMNQLVFKDIALYTSQYFSIFLYCLMQIAGALSINKLCKLFHKNVK